MSLSLRQKRDFYHDLSQLVRSGVPFTKALSTLAERARGGRKQFVADIHAATEAGETISGAFQQTRGTTQMERSVIGAAAQSGRLDDGCRMLSSYFGTLEKARVTIKTRLAYPVFMMHFSVFLLNLPTILTNSFHAYLLTVVISYAALWFSVLIGFLAIRLLLRTATWNAPTDRFLLRLPMFGKLRRAFIMARFCAVYDMQLEAGINVLDGLTAAARASDSGAVNAAVEASLPDIRNGMQVGPLLGIDDVFPDEMMQAWRVGEETGGLDRELRRLAAEFEEESLRRTTMVCEVVSKGIYILTVCYLGWKIVSMYMNYLNTIKQLTNGVF